MSIKSVATDIGILVLVAVASASAGYVRGHDKGVADDNHLVLAAQQDAATAQGNARTSGAALLDLRQRLATQHQELLDLQQVATAALDQRDMLAQKLADEARRRIAADRKAAHENPDCSELEHLPVCPVLARRLFGKPPKAAAADPVRTGGDRQPGAGVPAGG